MVGKGSDSDSTCLASNKAATGVGKKKSMRKGRKSRKEKADEEESNVIKKEGSDEETAMIVDESEVDDDEEDSSKNNNKKKRKTSVNVAKNKNNNNNVNATETTDNDEDEEAIKSFTTSQLDDEDDEDREDDEDDDDDESSSEMDVQECEKKRVDCIDHLADLEKQFSILREQLYRERMTQISAKLSEVRSGKASEYLQPLEELQANMRTRMEVASVLRHLRIQNIECKYNAEILAAEQNFESEKELLWDQLKADLEDKIHRLEEDKHNVDLSLWDPCEPLGGKQRRRPKGSSLDELDRRKKPVSVVGPYLVYMIKDAEIMEDWAVIKRSLSQQQRQHKRVDVKAS